VKCTSTTGYDLTGVFVGSEGTLGITLPEVTLRILKSSESIQVLLADFTSIELVGQSFVSDIIAHRVCGGIEMMDILALMPLRKM
jgi:glycolate oxidase